MAEDRQGNERIDRAERIVAAPPAAVYRALTDGEVLEAWLPPEGMGGRIENFDPRLGGGFRMVLTYGESDAGHGKTSETTDVTEVRFDELVPGERVVQSVDFDSDDPAFLGTMIMTWRMEPVPQGTRVTIEATGVPPGIRAEDHEVGLRSSLANLAGHVEP
ncbi:SRPBCC family protein [Nocardiopsis sp. L17-MgMaSL7]|uniref:SRPBCC family protein n=1 Tax=Nocardiopsis sp. L17-MgMaSL7 TaxID=1938893 RepID=UPI000D712553|nr:SRPBCC family protein [Nocardiopsis sp. L17-MgMaSL7]PWV54884.1 uncharacterized protein YndB with AHSA1/START domain [Nocardiopsis sp. L17-MgMaSL7]